MAIIYLLITYLSGYIFMKRIELFKKGNTLLNVISSMGIGTLLMGWTTYLFSYMASIAFPEKNPMLYGNLLAGLIWILIIVTSLISSMGIGTLIIGWIYFLFSHIATIAFPEKNPMLGVAILAAPIWLLVVISSCGNYKKSRIFVFMNRPCYKMKKGKRKVEFEKWRKHYPEGIFFMLLLAFLSYVFFYVFYIDRENILHAGATVFSDYAPHTAMMRSFSSGGNFPTQYPHFGGEDIRYHFMYQFFCGNLEYLGLPTDLAYNIPSIFFLWGFLVFLYYLSVRVSGKKAAGILAVIFLLFRSSFSFFMFVFEHIQNGDLLSALSANNSFIGYTTNENWGLWNFNVYLNQRHLGFGLLIGAMLIWAFMDYIEERKTLKELLFSKEAWKFKDIKKAVCFGILLGGLSFWNGAVVIATLLVLCGFAIFSYGKLDYLVVAIISIILSKMQVLFFMDGYSPDFSFYFGFLAADKTIGGVIEYILILTGVFFIGVLLMLLLFKGKNRYLAFSFLLPTIFAFTVSMTGDITVNHKYIMISMALEGVLWAYVIVKLWGKKEFRVLAGGLVFLLTITGMFDMITIFRANGNGKEIKIDLTSDLTCWLQKNVATDELILTPPYAMNEITMSGRMLYYGWPYYAWSAGYDTDHRSEVAKCIYTGSNEHKIREYVLSESISWILIDENAEYDGIIYSNPVIENMYPLVYEEDGIKVYNTKS